MDKTIEYKTNKKVDKIKIFGEEFVKNNENNLKIIFDKEEHPLTSFFDLSNNKNNNKFIEIQFKIINDIYNLSYMFSGCKELLSASFITTLKVDEKNTDISFMFSNCSSLLSLPDISN